MLPCSTCKAECCYSPALTYREHEHFLTRLGPELVHEMELPNGLMIRYLGELGKRCPLLKQNRCSIYEERPLVCRKFGEVPEARCPKTSSLHPSLHTSN